MTLAVTGHHVVPRPGRLAVLMRAVRDRPEHAIIAVLAAAVAVGMTTAAADAASGLARLNDFYHEAAPSYLALMHGHVLGFARLTPPYGGSLVLRAPFALLPALWGGSLRAVYFASALPCMLAAVAFCVWLAAQPRQRGASWPARIVAIVCCIGNPLVLIVLFGGHPEEVLGAVLCVAAVILAVDGRAEWAGVLVGLAVANKPWALVAVPVVVAALPARRWRALLLAAGSAGAVLLPLAAVRAHGLSAAANGADVGALVNPPQLLWWFGHRSWIVRDARPGIVLASLLLTALWCGARRGAARPTASRAPEALLLLALVLLLRAALDPWNNLWYHIPFLFAVLAFEIRSGRPPLVMAACMMALLIVVPVGGVPMSTDLRAAVYAAIVLPMIAGLVVKLYLPSVMPGRLRARMRRIPPRLSTDSASVS
jgi:alpha-1,6-mannosyltransferase